MSEVIIGSARHDEFGKLAGKAGDQLQAGTGNDFKGEVSMQQYYKHKYDWYVLRFKDVANRHKMAERMVKACNNSNNGYSQPDRLAVVRDGVESKKPTNGDCGTYIRRCFIEATGKDPGNFYTETEVAALTKTGLVELVKASEKELMIGDILVSKKKGHTAVVILGKSPEEPVKPKVNYYFRYTGKSTSLVEGLKAVGEKDTSLSHRKKIAAVNGISGYVGASTQNTKLLNLLKNGKLIKA